MDLEILNRIATLSQGILRLRKELKRYYDEKYLSDTKEHTPWISVKIGNHPTYLSDFVVDMRDDEIREEVVKLAIKQIKKTIAKWEKELEELLVKAMENE